MTKMSVGEFEANPRYAIAMVDAGVTVELTREGVVVAELVPNASRRAVEREAALQRLQAAIDRGIPFGRTFTYEERTG